VKLKLMILGWFLLLPLAGLAQTASETAEAPENRFLAMLRVLQEDPAPGKTFRIPESDLNAFVTEEVARHRVSAVEKVVVLLLDGHFSAELLVDTEQLEFEDSMTGALLQSMLKGKQTLKLEGVVSGAGGTGRYETRRAWLNGVALPASLVDTILKTIGKRQDPPFDPTRPFNLPSGIQDITLYPGEVEVKT
jgi:hypothetical protein